jgi:hypothetical protein
MYTTVLFLHLRRCLRVNVPNQFGQFYIRVKLGAILYIRENFQLPKRDNPLRHRRRATAPATGHFQTFVFEAAIAITEANTTEIAGPVDSEMPNTHQVGVVVRYHSGSD